MSWAPPEYLQNYLNQEWRKPPENFVNFSQYYANLDPYFITYMTRVIRPCIAFASGSADNWLNSGLNMNIGYAIKKTAVKLIKGDKLFFDGDDSDCRVLSDTWSGSVGFPSFVECSIDDMLTGGTAAIRLNKDRNGRCVPVSTRVDRYYASYDDTGEVLRIAFINSFLYSEKCGNNEQSYWLVEERYYKNGKKYIRYKVQTKSGVAASEVLPTIDGDGLRAEDLSESAQQLLKVRGIKLNKEMPLPFRDGLGVWLLRTTATNSAVPGLPMGDPLLYGALDLLWSVNVVFSGALSDVLLGKGKILVPERYLSTFREEFKALGINDQVKEARYSNSRNWNDKDESLVYIWTERDKDFTPQAVQFDIRTESYKGMLEMYLRQIVAHCGYAPSTVFPFLVDGAAKTAREVTAEENLSRASVQGAHQTICPVYDRLINEVLYQLYKDMGQKYNGNVKLRLSDYIGNPLLRDENIRNNYAQGLIPKEMAVQQVNSLSAAETAEYMSKLSEESAAEEEARYKAYGGGLGL